MISGSLLGLESHPLPKGEGIFLIRPYTSRVIDGIEKVLEEQPQLRLNKVVDLGRNYLARMTLGDRRNFINALQLGTDPTPSQGFMESLVSPCWPPAGTSGVFDSHDYPSTGMGTLYKRISGSAFGGSFVICEAAVFFDDGTMFDRVTFPGIPVYPANVDGVQAGVIIEWSILY